MRTLKKYSLDKKGLPTAAAIKAYERDGVVCLKNAFDEAWVGQGPVSYTHLTLPTKA